MLGAFICGVVLPQHVVVQRLGENTIRVYVSEQGIAFPYYSSLKDAKKFITKPQEEGNRIVTGPLQKPNFWIYRKEQWVKTQKL